MAKKRLPRLASKERRGLILTAAMRCIKESGVHNTTLAAIAREAKVQPPLVSYYFPTLDTLMAECVAMMLESLKAHMLTAIERETGQPRSAIRHFILSPLDWAHQRPEMQPVWLYFYHLCATQDRFRKINSEIRRVGRERISLMIYQHLERAKSKLPPPWTVESLAWTLQAMVTGQMVMLLTEDTDRAHVKQRLTTELDHLLDSVLPATKG